MNSSPLPSLSLHAHQEAWQLPSIVTHTTYPSYPLSSTLSDLIGVAPAAVGLNASVRLPCCSIAPFPSSPPVRHGTHWSPEHPPCWAVWWLSTPPPPTELVVAGYLGRSKGRKEGPSHCFCRTPLFFMTNCESSPPPPPPPPATAPPPATTAYLPVLRGHGPQVQH